MMFCSDQRFVFLEHHAAATTSKPFSEHPYLTGEFASKFIHRLQDAGSGACIKHPAANDQETRRVFIEESMTEYQPWALIRATTRLTLGAWQREGLFVVGVWLGWLDISTGPGSCPDRSITRRGVALRSPLVNTPRDGRNNIGPERQPSPANAAM
ncbi:Beta-glucosidase B [Fusarium agapanthi]|uniref:Beta-glucosidase B n=1 Tax=Fusarium agapanthi TaxID=1803897 RepID=A0A9P5BDQ2_9HYPO|nr:Beta-glucosidase B [Fusarium agapanthi]